MPDAAVAPTAPARVRRFTEDVMGTVVSFAVHDHVPASALTTARQWLHQVDRVFSTYRSDSDISRLDRGDCRLEDCHPDVAVVLDLCARAAASTDGWFSATAGGRLDPSGLVKGWAVERASDILRAAGSCHHLVNGGGDVQTVGGAAAGTPWQVGITDPHRPDRLVDVVDVTDGAVATSGTAERGHHLVDPHTGRAATAFSSVSVTARHLTVADVIATAAFVRGLDAVRWVAGMTGVEGLFITPGGEVVATPGWPGSAVSTRERPAPTR